MSCSVQSSGPQGSCSPSNSPASSDFRAGSSDVRANGATAAETLAQSPTTAQRLAGAPTALDAIAQAPTLVQHIEQAPTAAEQLAQEPTTAERLTCTPPRPDLTGPIAGAPGLNPAADYQDGVTAADLADAMAETAAHACRQWATGLGVVGPTGAEDGFPYARYNNPEAAHYALNQQFGFHHDMQATDAQLQVGTEPDTYAAANMASAIDGFTTLNRTGDIAQALQAAQAAWAAQGFEVQARY
jgi:hypothetical protein